ncbi:protein LNK2 [Cinnamomum micranthum f. kanehirae]|uniref:Protein LNK2 n=1 Tax=Cinnamomum micranthum f. kanehirae TaxID=337451 RepID=A0A443NCD5_9MAGN|nr:protein LNK2 [Cinnamomum micranthum f. kanehirae]
MEKWGRKKKEEEKEEERVTAAGMEEGDGYHWVRGITVSLGQFLQFPFMLVGIIWGDANDSDDHIVPYPKGSEENKLYTYEGLSKKQTSQEVSIAVKSGENKTSEDKNDLFSSRPEEKSYFNINEELSPPRLDMDSWPADTSHRDSIGNKVPNDFPDVTSLDSIKGNIIIKFVKLIVCLLSCRFTNLKEMDILTAYAGRPHADPVLFGNGYEDKESGFLDYSWANIGNFDDLDNIFRNDDSILGNEIIGHADELWSSSANLIGSSPTKSHPIATSSPGTGIIADRSTSEQFNVKKEFKPFKSQPLVRISNKTGPAGPKTEPLEEKTEDSTETSAETSVSQSHIHNISSGIDCRFGDKVNREKKQLKFRKKADEKKKAKSLQNMYGAWSPTSNQNQQFGNVKIYASTSSVPEVFPPSVLSPQRQHGGLESLRYLHASSPFMNMAYGYPTHHFPIMPMSPLPHSDWDRSQMVTASCNYSLDSSKPANLLKKLADVPSRQSPMTPQEKIEKLRRRQQIQAMLAIQQQKQQLGHQVTCIDQSVNHNCLQENTGHDSLQTNFESDENVVKFPSQELNLPTEQEDSSKISTLNDESTLEETIFNQLQDVMGKLDVKTRLSIRDGLFRLAKSAIRRHNICDISSTNKRSNDEDEVLGSEEASSDYRTI